MDYKKTLNLPKTDFAMKANLSIREPALLAAWEESGLYQRMLKNREKAETFLLHDGPPYANGHIHIGHALNKILKDVIVRYKFMRGYRAPYVPGWDCHGLPVEHQLFKDLGLSKEEIDRVVFRKKAHTYAMKFVGIQKEEFERLGIVGRWEDPYLTLNKDYEYHILRSFGALVAKGFIYRGLKPVNWCFRCETALAEAEVEYADIESDSVYVKFKLLESKKLKELGIKTGQGIHILIWTTTPWTLLSNVAVAVHPEMDYVLLAHAGERFIMALELFKTTGEFLGLKEASVQATFKGRDLADLSYGTPFNGREGRLVLADYVSKEEGTGCVHTAPGHGQEDFMTAQKFGLDVLMPVCPNGLFDESAGTFKGQHVFSANAKIIESLHREGGLFKSGKITHAYPHCWRCKTAIIFRATKQWFLKIDHNGLREELLKVVKEVHWIPPAGLERISAMIEKRPDWCLSRQRYWGVPIPAVICSSCGEHVLEAKVVDRLSEVTLEEGTDAWFKRPVRDFLPEGFCCSCSGSDFKKSTDILDVWFDSGVSHQAVLKDKPGLKLPADLYLEGSDQHRGWFQTSLIPSMALDGQPAFRSVLTHGFVVDGDGRKMSKSLGNVISPQAIIKDYGADILRLWVFSSDYKEDVRISKEILASIADAYRKIRNTMRFLLGNINDFVPEKDHVHPESLLVIDRWALSRLADLLKEVTDHYEAYRFYHAFQKIFAFCNEEMSSVYLDILKDRLYTSAKSSCERRSAQTVLSEILSVLVRILAPVLPFTTEEVAAFLPHGRPSSDAYSIHLAAWPQISDVTSATARDVDRLNAVLQWRPTVLKALEEARAEGKIGSSLEAKVRLSIADQEVFALFNEFTDELPSLFIVSAVEVQRSDAQQEAVAVSVSKADGEKCIRCWNYKRDIGEVVEHPLICRRCAKAVVA